MLVDTIKKSTDTFRIINNRGGFFMETRSRPKGGKNVMRSKEEKFKFVSMILNDHVTMTSIQKEYGINTGLLHQWVKKYSEDGMDGLENSKEPRNKLVRYQSRKELTYEEELEFKILKLEIENERLKKGYTNEEADQRSNLLQNQNTKLSINLK